MKLMTRFCWEESNSKDELSKGFGKSKNSKIFGLAAIPGIQYM